VRAKPSFDQRSRVWCDCIERYVNVQISSLNKINRQSRPTYEGTTICAMHIELDGLCAESELLGQLALAAATTCESHCGDLIRIPFANNRGSLFYIIMPGDVPHAEPMRWIGNLAPPWELTHPQWPIMRYGEVRTYDNVSFAGCTLETDGEHILHGSVGKSGWHLTIEEGTPFLPEYAALLTCPQAPPVTVSCETSDPRDDLNCGEVLFDIKEYKEWSLIFNALLHPQQLWVIAQQFPVYEHIPVYRLSTFECIYGNAQTNTLIRMCSTYIERIIEMLVACGLVPAVARLIASQL